jgi:DNA-directed RNA polymerase specialized sigma24 family protein
MRRLSQSRGRAVTLSDVQGLPQERIAKMMDRSAGTVRLRLFHARFQAWECRLEYLQRI